MVPQPITLNKNTFVMKRILMAMAVSAAIVSCGGGQTETVVEDTAVQVQDTIVATDTITATVDSVTTN